MDGGIRLRDAAARLFYEKGYPNTGIRDLCEAGGVGRSTMYHFYKSKEEIGQEYLSLQIRANIAFLKMLSRRSKTPQAFIKSWVKKLLELHSNKDYFGCPLANLGAQQAWGSDEFQKQLSDGFNQLESVICDYYKQLKAEGKLRNNANVKKLSRLTLTIYEGAVILFKSTGNVDYIRGLEASLSTALESSFT